MERALETQRVKLLRLLAGLAVVLGLVALAPAVSLLPRWVHSYVASLLVRVESAVRSLVLAQACILAKADGHAVDRSRLLLRPAAIAAAFDSGDEPPSLAVLHGRINALQRVLKDFQRHGQRLLRRSIKRISGHAVVAPVWCSLIFVQYADDGFGTSQWAAPTPWHPPKPPRDEAPNRRIESDD